jgi:type VI secretion system FHA domain protein
MPGSSVELADPHVSRVHAHIHYSGGAFYLENKSQAGTYLNNTMLESGQRYPLQQGDLILIDPYEIHVSIASAPAAVPDDPFALLGGGSGERPSPFPDEPLVDAEEEVDPLNLLGGPAARPASATSPPRRTPSLQQIPPEREQYVAPPILEPPTPSPSRNDLRIPNDFDPLHSTGTDPGPTESDDPFGLAEPLAPTPPQRPPAARQSDRKAPQKPGGPSQGGRGPGTIDADLTQVLVGAGLRPEVVTPELAQDFGRILRAVVGGLMDVLQARQKTKDEFRLGATSFKPAGNNPLKFSANVEDALHNLLVKRNKAYLPPVEAFEDAFDDVRHHQVAMLAGVRVAFEAMLAQFDPDRLQERFDRQKKGALLSVPAKLRYWDQYRDWIRDMVRDAEGSFRELFGDEFAEAYEEQLKALKARGRSRER